MTQAIDRTFEIAAQARRDGDARSALDLYLNAIASCRLVHDEAKLAYGLRHAAALSLKVGDPIEAEKQIDEAIHSYRMHADENALNLANALRIHAHIKEHQTRSMWQEAKALYGVAGVQAGVTEAEEHLRRMPSVGHSGGNL